jgi:hypothetical protein
MTLVEWISLAGEIQAEEGGSAEAALCAAYTQYAELQAYCRVWDAQSAAEQTAAKQAQALVPAPTLCEQMGITFAWFRDGCVWMQTGPEAWRFVHKVTAQPRTEGQR